MISFHQDSISFSSFPFHFLMLKAMVWIIHTHTHICTCMCICIHIKQRIIVIVVFVTFVNCSTIKTRRLWLYAHRKQVQNYNSHFFSSKKIAEGMVFILVNHDRNGAGNITHNSQITCTKADMQEACVNEGQSVILGS